MRQRFNLRLTQLLVIVSNLLPVYGAATGRLIFFQVIYLYWLEGFIVIFFDALKISLAHGTNTPSGLAFRIPSGQQMPAMKALSRLWLAIKYTLLRCFILLFYSIFLFAFIAFRVTGKAHSGDVLSTIVFRQHYFNLSLIMFIISATVSFVGRFLIGGEYRLFAPRTYATFLDGRTLMLHIMIISVVFIHQFLFEGKSYAERGEIVYVGLFMLVKTIIELFMIKPHGAAIEVPD